jgi:hypothetical protein
MSPADLGAPGTSDVPCLSLSPGFRCWFDSWRWAAVKPCIPYRRGRKTQAWEEAGLSGYRQRWQVQRTYA